MTLFSVSVAGEALAAAAVETLIQGVASSSKGVELVRWAVSFNGSSVSEQPVRVDLLRVSSAGTSSAFAPIKLDPTSDSALMTARTSHTAEPTPGDVIETHYVTPAGGLLYIQYAPDERVKVPASTRLGIRVLSPSAVNASALLIFNE